MEHLDHLNIGTSMQRTFQRTDTGGDAGIGIRTGRAGDTYCKRRVVTTSVFSLQYQQQVEHTGFQRRIILFNHIKEVLGQRQVLVRVTDMQGTSVDAVTINVVSIRNDGRELRNQLDGLTHQVVA